MNSYRVNASQGGTRRLPRRLAWFRGVFRRIVVPTIWIASLTAAAMVVCFFYHVGDTSRISVAEGDMKRHFIDWQRGIDDEEKQLNLRRQVLDKRELELNMRVHDFDLIINMAPLLVTGGNSAPLVDAVKRLNISNEPSSPSTKKD